MGRALDDYKGRFMEATQDHINFDHWMELIDYNMKWKYGLGYLDLEDQTWYDWYESGYTVKQAIQEAIENDSDGYLS